MKPKTKHFAIRLYCNGLAAFVLIGVGIIGAQNPTPLGFNIGAIGFLFTCLALGLSFYANEIAEYFGGIK